MRFTIDGASDLAREIKNRTGSSGSSDMTLSIVAHNPTYTDVQRLIIARLMSWTLRKVTCCCPNCPTRELMDVEWLDIAEVEKWLTPWPTLDEGE